MTTHHSLSVTIRGYRSQFYRLVATNVALFILALSATNSAEISVSTKGLDSNSGSSREPLRSLARASAVADDGDVIRFSSGFYPAKLVLEKKVVLVPQTGIVTIGRGLPTVSAGADQTRQICEGAVGKPLRSTEPQSVLSNGDLGEVLKASDQISTPGLGEVELGGAVTDPNGGWTASWSVLSGPGEFRIQAGNNPAGAFGEFNGIGRYLLRLTVTDGDYTVYDDVAIDTEAVRCSPGGGPNCEDFRVEVQPIQTGMQGAPITFNAVATFNNTKLGPTGVKATWQKVDGPGSVHWDLQGLTAIGRFSQPGRYEIELIAAGKSGLSCSKRSSAIVIVSPSKEVEPPDIVVYAGQDERISRNFPDASTRLNAQVFLKGIATPKEVKWTWPPGVSVVNPTSLTPLVNFDRPGTYELKVCASYQGKSYCDSVRVTVIDAGEVPITEVNAGPNQTLLLEGNSVSTVLSGSYNSQLPVKFKWELIPGKAGVKIDSPEAIATRVSFTEEGEYILRFQVYSKSYTVANSVHITVNKAARQYITWEIPSPSVGYCCGQTFVFKNTHPTCAIEFVIQSVKCIQESVDPHPLTISLGPGAKQGQCTGGSFSLVSARFLCQDSVPAQTRVAGLKIPAITDNQLSSGVLEFLVDGDSQTDSIVEVSQDLIEWRAIGLAPSGDQPIWMADPDAGSHSRRFYRVVPR